MANADSTQAPIINGHYPLTSIEIECFGHIAYEQAMAMSAIFRSIARLTEDKEIVALCNHGGLQADLQGNDIDVIAERAAKAGVYHGSR